LLKKISFKKGDSFKKTQQIRKIETISFFFSSLKGRYSKLMEGKAYEKRRSDQNGFGIAGSVPIRQQPVCCTGTRTD
jgi:hypothetical protein